MWAHKKKKISEYLNGRACELGCGRDVRDPAVCIVCVSVFKQEAQHYFGNSSVLKVGVRDLGVYLCVVLVCACTLERASNRWMLVCETEVGVMQEHKRRVEERISNTVGIHGYVCVSLRVTPLRFKRA